MEQQRKLKAVVLGGTGSVGRELVKELCESGNWTEVTVIVRRVLDSWKEYQDKNILKVIKVESLDKLENIEEWKSLQGNDSMFCCLGGDYFKLKEEQYKITDYVYPVNGAKIAKAYNIKHFGLLTGEGSGSKLNSCLRIKGESEDDIRKLKFPGYSIYRPGSIYNRCNNVWSWIEWVKPYVPFMSKISTQNLAKAFKLDAEQYHYNKKNNSTQEIQNTVYYNKDLINMAKQ